MNLPVLNSFHLVGGTALALKFGHRNSVDLDLFSVEKINRTLIEKKLRKEFGKELIYEKTKITFAFFCHIEKIKVDLVFHPHPLIGSVEIHDNIRMFNTADIAAMKISAILGRAQKKDFFDMAELLNHFSLKEICEFYKKKFPDQMLLISIPSALCYFSDAEESPTPVVLNKQTWSNVKKQILQAVREYLS